MKAINAKKTNFIKTLENKDFKIYCQYARLADVIEVFRGHQCASISDKIELVKISNVEGLYFLINGSINVEYKVDVLSNNKLFNLNELLLTKYNEFERNFNNY